MEIKILKNVMVKNNAIGNDNREIFNNQNVFVLNLTSSPGAGKTTLIKSTLELINDVMSPSTSSIAVAPSSI